MKSENQTAHVESEPVSVSPGTDDSDEVQAVGKGDFGAFWILIVVVVMAGSTFWMIRDVWLHKPVSPAVSSQDTPPFAPEKPVTVAPEPAAQASVAASAPAADEDDREAQSKPTDLETRRQQREERLLAVKQEAQRVEQERLEAEQLLEEERAARAALEQERIAAEKKLEAEREARLVLEEQRRRAEEKLARERAAREALEREARLEQQRLLRAQQEAGQAARERARVEAERLAAEKAAAAAAESVAEALPVVVTDAAPGDAASEPAAAGTEGQVEDSSTFSSNPCAGPSAKFLSTCR